MISEQEYALVAIDDVRAEIERFRDACVAAIVAVDEAGGHDLADKMRASASRALADWCRAYAAALVAAASHATGERSLASVVAPVRELIRDIDHAVDKVRAAFDLDEES